MPLRLPDKLPAIELLKHENIFVMDDSRAHMQDIRPLRMVILNLMPLKITTETDLIRLLSNTPLQLEISFMKLKSHTPKNTPIEHMMMFYRDFEELRHKKFDGMIITGLLSSRWSSRMSAIGTRCRKSSLGLVLMYIAPCISAGQLKQAFTSIMAYRSTL